MTSQAYIYSTMSNDVLYTDYAKRDARRSGPNVVKSQILVKGGANVVDRKHIITPKGVMTRVTASELKTLEANPVFKRHKKNGFISVDSQELAVDRAVKDMADRDGSAPLTDESYRDSKIKPIVDKK